MPARSPDAHVDLSPQLFLQTFSLLDILLHLHSSLHVQLPEASLHVQDVSQVHFPSTAQLICLLSFTEQHLLPANDEKVTAKITNKVIDRNLIVISFKFIVISIQTLDSSTHQPIQDIVLSNSFKHVQKATINLEIKFLAVFETSILQEIYIVNPV